MSADSHPRQIDEAVIEDMEGRLSVRIRREGIYERALQEIAKTPHTGSPYTAWETARKALQEASELASSHFSLTRGWRKTIHIKHLLSTDDSEENARQVAAKIGAVLKRQREYREGEFDDFSVLADEMADIEHDEHGADYTAVEHVNDCLAALYDWADAERVWIG